MIRMKKKLILAAAIIITLQVGLWLGVGIRSLPRTVPRMIEMDIAEARQALLDLGQLPEKTPSGTFVLCETLASGLGESGIVRIKNVLEPLGYKVVTETEAPEGWMQEYFTQAGFCQLCSHVDWNTPLVAQVEIVFWSGPLAANGSGHRAWFVLGFWIPTRAFSEWVS